MTKTYDRWELFLSILVQFIWFGFAFKATSHLLISLVLILPLIVTCSLSLHHFYIVRHVFWKLTPTRFRKLYYFHLLTHCISMDSPDVINPLLNKFKVNSEELAQILNDYLSEEWLNHEVDIWKKMVEYNYFSYGYVGNTNIGNMESNYPKMLDEFRDILKHPDLSVQLDNYLFNKFIESKT